MYYFKVTNWNIFLRISAHLTASRFFEVLNQRLEVEVENWNNNIIWVQICKTIHNRDAVKSKGVLKVG